MPKAHPYCYLYVFRSRRKGVKIGVACAHTLKRRLNYCQTWSDDYHKPFSRVFHLPGTAYEHERRAKQRLAELDPDHYGEWFRLPLRTVLKVIEEA